MLGNIQFSVFLKFCFFCQDPLETYLFIYFLYIKINDNNITDINAFEIIQ